MGTYIKAVVEILTSEGWVPNASPVFYNYDRQDDPREARVPQPNLGQNYELFTLLAGVREVEGITPLSKPRGLPEDTHSSTLFDLAGPYESCPFGYEDEPANVADYLSRRSDIERFAFSWVGVDELLHIDYELMVPVRMEQAKTTSLRDALGDRFFNILEQIQLVAPASQARMLFCFT